MNWHQCLIRWSIIVMEEPPSTFMNFSLSRLTNIIFAVCQKFLTIMRLIVSLLHLYLLFSIKKIEESSISRFSKIDSWQEAGPKKEGKSIMERKTFYDRHCNMWCYRWLGVLFRTELFKGCIIVLKLGMVTKSFLDNGSIRCREHNRSKNRCC